MCVVLMPAAGEECHRPKLLSGFWVDLDYLFRRPHDGRSPGGKVRGSKAYIQSLGPVFNTAHNSYTSLTDTTLKLPSGLWAP